MRKHNLPLFLFATFSFNASHRTLPCQKLFLKDTFFCQAGYTFLQKSIFDLPVRKPYTMNFYIKKTCPKASQFLLYSLFYSIIWKCFKASIIASLFSGVTCGTWFLTFHLLRKRNLPC